MDGKLPLKLSINGVYVNGYGNRMYSILTSFVIAILTDRALIIKWESMHPYIKEPFNMTFYNFTGLQNEFNVDYKMNEVYNFTWSTNNWRINKTLNELVKTTIPDDKKRIYYHLVDAQFFSICSNPIYYEKLYETGLVERETIDAASVILTDDKADEPTKVEKMLRVGFEVGGNLLRNYWQTTDNFSTQVNYYYENFFKGHFVIGIQVRMEFLQGTDPYDVFVRCALGVEDQLAIAAEPIDPKTIRWFVTSDSQDIMDQIDKKFPGKLIRVNGTVGHMHSNDKAIAKTLLDNELLSMSQEIIMTGASSYGFLAAMKSARLPLFVRGAPNQTQCQRATLYRPPTRLGYACF